MGKDEKTIIDRSLRQNMPLPERIRDAPELLPGLEYFYKAFQRLTSSRQIGQGVIGAITYPAISQFCADEGLEDDEREDMFFHVEHLDAAYMEWWKKKSANSNPSPPPSPAPGRGRRR